MKRFYHYANNRTPDVNPLTLLEMPNTRIAPSKYSGDEQQFHTLNALIAFEFLSLIISIKKSQRML